MLRPIYVILLLSAAVEAFSLDFVHRRYQAIFDNEVKKLFFQHLRGLAGSYRSNSQFTRSRSRQLIKSAMKDQMKNQMKDQMKDKAIWGIKTTTTPARTGTNNYVLSWYTRIS